MKNHAVHSVVFGLERHCCVGRMLITIRTILFDVPCGWDWLFVEMYNTSHFTS